MSIETLTSSYAFEHFDEDDNHLGKCVLLTDLPAFIRAALTGDEVEAAAGAAVFGRRPDLGRALSRQIAAAALGGAADALGGER